MKGLWLPVDDFGCNRTIANTNLHPCLLVRVVRYMKYATAVYGETMIRAAEMDVLGKFDNRLSPVTRTRISEHCSIPVEDIVLMDVDYGGDVSVLFACFESPVNEWESHAAPRRLDS
jgi:hypothetical protein